MSDFNRSIRENTGLRLMVLFGSFCVLLSLASVIFLLLSKCESIGERNALLMSSAIQCVLAFCLPAMFCGMFASRKSVEWLGLSTPLRLKSIIGVLILYVLVLPAMNQLIAWNASIHLPDWASGIEASLREMEDAAGDTTNKILSFTGIGGMLATIGVVGLLTGFSEELFFRGALQKVFSQSRMSEWLAIWGAAFIFSAVHFQFFGFLPRLLMGAMFGYLYVWSKSLWLPIFAHALNNSVVVATSHTLGNDLEGESVVEGSQALGIDSFGIASDGEIPWAAIASAIATAIFLYRFRGYFFCGRRTVD